MLRRSPIFLIVLMLVTSCSPSGVNPDIAVRWEVEENILTPGGSAQGTANLRLTNRGRTALTGSNWVMHFNMMPRDIVPAGREARADIIHINGDWYKAVPRNDFRLEPDSSVTIRFQYRGWILKDTDAPRGLYMVYFNEQAEEEELVPVVDYEKVPLTRKSQLRPLSGFQHNYNPAGDLYAWYSEFQASPASVTSGIIPKPYAESLSGDSVLLDASYTIAADSGLEKQANLLSSGVEQIASIKIPIDHEDSGGRTIRLHIDTTMAREEYKLAITPDSITICGRNAGVSRGVQTLLQLLLLAETGPSPKQIPCLSIEDMPRFSYRGLHIDVSRNFQPKEQILKVLDLMALYKLNTLNLCLTDDEGWRLAIEGLPELIQVGARRAHPTEPDVCLPPAYGSGPFAYAVNNYGTGFYTRRDFIEILKYAHARDIDVVPLVNFPGHARAAIQAMERRYLRFAEEGNMTAAEEFRLIDPDDRSAYRSAQFYNDNVVCVARPSVYRFYEKVLDEIVSAYEEAGAPLNMIHTGGDEVPYMAWSESPLCDSLRAELHARGEDSDLQYYFFTRINRILEERNLRSGGWEEVVLHHNDRGVRRIRRAYDRKQVIPYIWNDLGDARDLALRISEAGYPVILAPVSSFYFDLAYSNDPREPGLYWGGYNNLYDAWTFAPTQLVPNASAIHAPDFTDTLNPVLGLQGQLWHETIRGTQAMEYYLLPKLTGLAERAWSAAPPWEEMDNRENRDETRSSAWSAFQMQVYASHLPSLAHYNGGYHYRIPPVGSAESGDSVYALAVSPALIIRYTTDGSLPGRESEIYTGPLPAGLNYTFMAFDRYGRHSLPLSTYGSYFPE